MKKIILSCLISLYALGLSAHKDKTVTEKKNAPWMDSVIAEGVRKISEADFYLRHPDLKKKADPFQELNLGSFMIVIDAAKWTPNVVPSVYTYEKTGAGNWGSPNNGLRDSIADYNFDHIQNPSNYVAYYNVIINNFPLELSKDVSTVGNNSNQIMFTQLQQLKAIENEPYKQATECFYTIIKNIATLAEGLPSIDDVVILGSANLLGQYGNKDQMRASYLAQTVVIRNIDTNLTWVGQLGRIPDFFKVPFVQLEPPTLAQRNTTVALAIRNFLDCNIYSICRPDNTIFTSPYAQWLYGNLAGSPNIDQAKLMNTALILNGLKNEMAWSVLTVEYESGHDQYVSTPLGPIYNAYTNGTLDTIALLSRRIQRAEWSLKNDANIYRDSALYYGWLLYRVPSYIVTIPTAQRVHLIDVLTNAACYDIQGAFDAGDYNYHCENVCLSLCRNVLQIDERTFLDELKLKGLLWDLSYRIDNSTAGFLGSENYTDLIFTLSAQWMRAYPEAAQNTNYITVQWSDDYFNANGAVTTNKPSNIVKLKQETLKFGMPVLTGFYELDVYAPVTIRVEEGGWLPGLQGVQYITVPAIFLDWLYHKKTLSDVQTTAHIAINAAALATGIGELYMATTWGMRALYSIQIAMNITDWILMDEANKTAIINCFQDTVFARQMIDAYQVLSLAINMTVAAKSLIIGSTQAQTTFVTRFDNNQSALSSGLGPTSPLFKSLEKLRLSIGAAKAATQWLDELELILGAAAKNKIQSWIDAGLDASKTEAAFASSANKLELFNNLDGAKGLYHRRIIIKDISGIPGISNSAFSNNCLPSQAIPASTFGEMNPAYDLPASRAKTFTESAELVYYSQGKKLYRVTDIGGEKGAFWTEYPPSSLADVIGGNAVMPEWNGYSIIVEYTVPPGGIKVWRGKTAAQPISEVQSLSSPNHCLMGGQNQIFINDFIRNDVNFTFKDVTQEYKTW